LLRCKSEGSKGNDTVFSGTEVSNLYNEMCRARKEWELASEKCKQATQLSRDVEGNSDGIASVRAANAREVEALKIYSGAVLAFAEAVKNSRQS
jgi:hypothetical protein